MVVLTILATAEMCMGAFFIVESAQNRQLCRMT